MQSCTHTSRQSFEQRTRTWYAIAQFPGTGLNTSVEGACPGAVEAMIHEPLLASVLLPVIVTPVSTRTTGEKYDPCEPDTYHEAYAQ